MSALVVLFYRLDDSNAIQSMEFACEWVRSQESPPFGLTRDAPAWYRNRNRKDSQMEYRDGDGLLRGQMLSGLRLKQLAVKILDELSFQWEAQSAMVREWLS